MGVPVLLNEKELPEKLMTLSFRCKDITGQKFGRLTVLYPSTKKKNDGTILWVCQCDCGNYLLRSGSDLKRKGGHDCGRHTSENQQERANYCRTELNGKIFTNLQVIGFDHIEGSRIFLKCKCLRCNNTTIVRKDSLVSGHKASCGCLNSKGESAISIILTEKNINFKREFCFKDLKDKGALRFDFALFKEEKIAGLIEFQGIQHFIASGWQGEKGLKITQEHDELKRQYCTNNNLKLFYINYNENIEEKIGEILDELYGE